MSKHRFALEEHIMNCWNVVDDIKAVHTAHQDRREMSVDEMSNVLMGLEHLYRIKFEALFECFEKHLMEIHEAKQDLVSEKKEGRLDELLREFGVAGLDPIG